ncbi:MAG TPA: S8 family serine peptidase [Acidimicrobiia bacterium]|nr:S8 family serine peptidase [Acidimicrobiia bacterium]
MMRRFAAVVFSLVTAVALAVPAVADHSIQPSQPVPTPDASDVWINETPAAWFVELGSPPAVQGTALSRLAAERQAFRTAAAANGLEYTERFVFETLFNGLSIEVAPGHLTRLAQMTEVKAIYPVMSVPMPATSVSGPQLATAITMTGADVAQSELGFTGAGIRVAVMDTGIDYHHPDLGGCFGPGCRVEVGWDFVGDSFNANPTSPSYDPVPVPDPDPDDCQGHGTHVAGIVGANGDAVGVAPEVTFGAYRVFGCDGSTTADIMIAAMERALADDMDILNMSIGSAFTWPQYPTAVASDLLVDSGMVVVASIGNSGANGTFSAGAPGLGEKVIGVAAFENLTATFPVADVLGAGDASPTEVGINPMQFAGEVPTSGTEEIVFVGRACNSDLPLLEDPAGKIALAVRGLCSFREKAQNAINAGAVAVVIHNSAPGNFSGTLGAPDEEWVVVSISREDGLFIRGLTAPVTWTWTDRVKAFPNPAAGLIASFSSYGLSPDLALKPDIGAPGGNIFSTYPLEKGGYANLGGTSMSAPHVAGAAALMLEARPATPAALMRDILQNSADPHAWWAAPSAPYREPVHRQGAGMLDIDDAILQDSIVSPGKLSLGESESGAPVVRQIRISNTGSEAITYTLGRETLFGCCSAAIATTGTFGVGFWLSAEVVEFSLSEVTVPAGGSVDVTVTVHPETPGGAFDLVQYGGWITITPDDGSDLLRVPYAGFIGDYQQLEVLTPGAFGVFPALGITDDGIGFDLMPSDWVYSMEGFDVPNILLHLHHQSRQMLVTLFNADGSPVHPFFNTVMRFDYLPRNATNAGFFAFDWDGTRFHSAGGKGKAKEVPDGSYFFKVSILKALGDSANPSHWETWTSPIFEIDRP